MSFEEDYEAMNSYQEEPTMDVRQAHSRFRMLLFRRCLLWRLEPTDEGEGDRQGPTLPVLRGSVGRVSRGDDCCISIIESPFRILIVR